MRFKEISEILFYELENWLGEISLTRGHSRRICRTGRRACRFYNPNCSVINMKTLYPDLELRSNGVNTPVDIHGKSPLDYIPNVVDAFKRIKKGSNYF